MWYRAKFRAAWWVSNLNHKGVWDFLFWYLILLELGVVSRYIALVLVFGVPRPLAFCTIFRIDKITCFLSKEKEKKSEGWEIK